MIVDSKVLNKDACNNGIGKKEIMLKYSNIDRDLRIYCFLYKIKRLNNILN